MKKIFLLFVVLLVLFSSCTMKDNSNSDLAFNITGAKVLAIGSASTNTKGFLSRTTRAGVTEGLVKILIDGTVESALTFGEDNGYNGWTPDISFMSVGEDGSVYICFEQMYTTWNQDTTTSIQFVRVYPDNTYDVLWPTNITASDAQEQVQTNMWYGNDLDPLVKDAQGNIYFLTNNWSSASQWNNIYKYSPITKGTPIRVTPEYSNMAIENFKVDVSGNIYIKSRRNGMSDMADWMRIYPAGSTLPTVIYHNSSGSYSSGVYGFTVSPTDTSVIINGYGINNTNGIMRVTYNAGSDPVTKTEQLYINSYENSYIVNSINDMIYDTNNNLYGLSVTTEGTKIVKLLDADGALNYSIVDLYHGAEQPGKVLFVGDYMYYRYAIMSNGSETGRHKLARLNLSTRDEEDVLIDTFFTGKELEILSYDVAEDNSMMYMSAFNYAENEVVFGQIDLSTKDFTQLKAESAFSNITVF